MKENLICKITDEDIGEKSVNMMNPKLRLGARGIVIREDGKIAIFNKSNKNEYKLPGGGLEGEEKPEEAFKREILEETGCKVRLKNVLPVMSKDIENTTLIIITFTTELLEENISFDEKEILDVKWISKEELLNMPDEKLRDEKRIRRTLKIFEENKVYPLDAVKILEDINS